MNLERMVVARRKLEGGKDIDQVAKDLGFMSEEAFCRRFYKMYGYRHVRFMKTRRIFNPANSWTKPKRCGPRR